MYLILDQLKSICIYIAREAVQCTVNSAMNELRRWWRRRRCSGGGVVCYNVMAQFSSLKTDLSPLAWLTSNWCSATVFTASPASPPTVIWSFVTTFSNNFSFPCLHQYKYPFLELSTRFIEMQDVVTFSPFHQLGLNPSPVHGRRSEDSWKANWDFGQLGMNWYLRPFVPVETLVRFRIIIQPYQMLNLFRTKFSIKESFVFNSFQRFDLILRF